MVEQLCKGIDMTGNGTITARNAAAPDQEREQQLAAALARCAAGDRAALQMIYNSEAPRMIGVARRILFRQDLAESGPRCFHTDLARRGRIRLPSRQRARLALCGGAQPRPEHSSQ